MTGSGNVIHHNIEVDDFTKVDVQGNFDVDIQQGTGFNVTISTDDNLISRILVSLENETLNVRIQAPANFFPTSLKITITMPKIYSLFLSNGAKASISGFSFTFNFTLNLTGGSTLSGNLNSGTSQFNVSNASQVDLTGQAREFDLTASKHSKLSLENFVIDDAQINLDGGSEAAVNVDGNLDVTLANASKIYYSGHPTLINEAVSDDSIIEHK